MRDNHSLDAVLGTLSTTAANVGLGAGAGTSGWPGGYGTSSASFGESLILGEQLSPSALLHVEQ